MAPFTRRFYQKLRQFEQRFETQRRGERREDFVGIATNETTLRVLCDSAFISLPMLKYSDKKDMNSSLILSEYRMECFQAESAWH